MFRRWPLLNLVATLVLGTLFNPAEVCFGQSQKQLQEIRSHLPLLDQKIQEAPTGELYFMRGLSNYALQNRAAAEADFNQAEAMNYTAQPFELNQLRGSNYLLIKKFDLAVQYLSRALEIKPHAVDCLGNRGVAYFELGRYREALADCLKASQMAPNYSGAYETIGACYLKTGQYKYALQYFNKAIALNPQNFEAVHFRGEVLKKMGNIVQANKDFADAKALGYAPGKYFEEAIK